MRNTVLANFRVVALVALALAVTTGCTKSKEDKNTVAANFGLNAQVAKSYFAGKTFHLSRGIEDADSDNTVGATPGMSDDFGLVQARITESELQFVSTFDPSGRESTMKIVASYPITKQFDIVNEKNDFGERTNKVVEDETNAWDKRAYMRVDWTKPSTSLSKVAAGLDSKQASGASDGGKAPPLTEENTVLLEEPKYEAEHLSFLVETSVKSDDKGTFVFPMSETASPAFRVVYRTHLLQAKASDFKPVPYTLADFNRFGFFFTQQNFQDPRGILEKNVHLFANVHNVCEPGQFASCSTNKIRWVLSTGFPEKFKAVARRVVAEWNKTFQDDLGRTDDVVYLDETAQATISDPSQNVLAYYPNRTKSGLLGVAQWVSDPRSGELVGVRATIYGDGIDYEVASVDDMINIIVAKGDPLDTVFGTTAFGTASGEVSPYNDKSVIASLNANRRVLGLEQLRAKSNATGSSLAASLNSARDAVSGSADKANLRMARLAAAAPETFAVQELSVLGDIPRAANFPSTIEGLPMPNLNGMEQMAFATTQMAAAKAKVLRDAELGIHGTELVEEAAIRYLMNYLKVHTPAELDQNRKMVEDQIAQETFYTTALHEMGHTFGLRHNFAGSADKNHYAKEYYSIKADLDSDQPTHVKEDLEPYASSSIMDYGRDFYSQKAGLGPYDRAAIKYAYNRSVDKATDKQLNPANPYLFCTDHQVDESILCRRFDRGANVSEVTAANILFYNTNFARMHYRRGRLSENLSQGWGSPGALMNSLLTRVFIPTRLVMDEFLYSFIVPTTVAGSGYCTLQFIKDSVEAGEMADICGDGSGDPRLAMEAARVDSMDVLGTLANALFVYDDKGQRVELYITANDQKHKKSSSDFRPYGLADLLFANVQAQDFFQSVIGAPEPGSYIAVPSKDANGQQVFKLAALDKDLPTVEEKLKAFAEAKGIDPTPDFLKNAASLVTDVKVGGFGRQLESVASIQGGFTRTDMLGSWWDKYAAIIALSAQGMPVEKYRVAKMSGNAYLFPQTRAFATAVFGKMIIEDDAISSIPVMLKDAQGQPVEVQAQAPAALNLDIQSLATAYGLTELVTEQDRTFAEKLRICIVDPRTTSECSQTLNSPGTARFRSATGTVVYEAAQNPDGDSIGYNIVAQAEKLDQQRDSFIKIRDAAGKNQIESLMALDNSIDLRDKVVAEIGQDAQLAALEVAKDSAGNALHIKDLVLGAWDEIKQITNALRTSQRFTAMTIVQQDGQNMAAIGQVVDQRIASLGDAGKCWVAAHPAPLGGAVKAPAVQLLSDRISTFGLLASRNALASPLANPPAAVNPAGPLCSDQKSGETLQNLLNVKADLATANAMVKIVVANDVKAIAAPIQVNLATNAIRKKENAVIEIRKLLYSALNN